MIYGKDYGIILKRGYLETILTNIPLINLLYTEKIRLDVVGWRKGPCCGIWKNFRVLKWVKKRTIKFLYALPDTFPEARVFIQNYGEVYHNSGHISSAEWHSGEFSYTFTNRFSLL